MMNKIYMDEKEIVAEIKEYINLKSVNYAVLIDGSWGSGKTYFIKNNLIKILEKNFSNKLENTFKRKVIYISLYGVKDICDLSNKIVVNLISDEKSKKLVPIINIGLNVISDLVNKHLSVKETDNQLKNLFKNFYPIDNSIIIFDDLERCNLDINIILGYINNLVEHNNVKCIIVADENKIGKINYDENLELKYLVSLQEKIDYNVKEDEKTLKLIEDNSGKINIETLKKNTELVFSQNQIYYEMKEKIIGRTIYYKPNINLIYDKIVREMIKNRKTQMLLIENKDLLIGKLDEYDYWNIRTIQFIFHAMYKINLIIIKMELAEDIYKKLMRDVFKYCIIKSLIVKKGIKKYNWEDDNSLLGNVFLDSINDYSSKNYVNGFRFVDNYILFSFLNEEQIKKSVEEYVYLLNLENNNPGDPLYKLKGWWKYSEKDVNDLLDEIIAKIKKNDYVLNLYSQIVFLISIISKTNLFDKKISIIIEELKNNINSKDVKGCFFDEDLFMTEKETANIYNNLIKEIKELANNKSLNDITTTLSQYLVQDSWANFIKKYFKANEGKFIGYKKFISYLDIKVLTDKILSSKNEEIFIFNELINKIYINMHNLFNEEDFIYLKNLAILIKKEKIDDGIKKYAVNNLTKTIDIIVRNKNI